MSRVDWVGDPGVELRVTVEPGAEGDVGEARQTAALEEEAGPRPAAPERHTSASAARTPSSVPVSRIIFASDSGTDGGQGNDVTACIHQVERAHHTCIESSKFVQRIVCLY